MDTIDEHILASGRPAYKSQEDYYDEIMELRQAIKGLKTENGVLKTKLQRITQENVLKVNIDRYSSLINSKNLQPREAKFAFPKFVDSLSQTRRQWYCGTEFGNKTKGAAPEFCPSNTIEEFDMSFPLKFGNTNYAYVYK